MNAGTQRTDRSMSAAHSWLIDFCVCHKNPIKISNASVNTPSVFDRCESKRVRCACCAREAISAGPVTLRFCGSGLHKQTFLENRYSVLCALTLIDTLSRPPSLHVCLLHVVYLFGSLLAPKNVSLGFYLTYHNSKQSTHECAVLPLWALLRLPALTPTATQTTGTAISLLHPRCRSCLRSHHSLPGVHRL